MKILRCARLKKSCQCPKRQRLKSYAYFRLSAIYGDRTDYPHVGNFISFIYDIDLVLTLILSKSLTSVYWIKIEVGITYLICCDLCV